MNVGHNSRIGIELAQQGRTAESLAYLRHAVMTEPVNEEVWLWLAHVSPDADEYRNCVFQALQINPHHPTALRMQQDVNFQLQGMPPPVVAAQASQAMERPQRRRRRLRRILILLNAILLVTVCGWLGNRVLMEVDKQDINSFIPLLEDSKTIQFAVGPEEDAYNFRVTVPNSWYLADKGSRSWRDERDRLQAEFPPAAGQPTIWREFEADLGQVERNATSGEFVQRVAVVETASERIAKQPEAVANMTLVAIRDMPNAADNACDNIREMADDSNQQAQQADGFITSEVVERERSDCVYVAHFRDEQDAVDTRFLQIYVPVGDDQLAIWHLTVPDVLYDDHYQEAIETIVSTLRFIIPA